jgi:Ca2+-binding RTX toxin-like protein
MLVSTTGNDIMTGAAGHDTFVFNGTNFGTDVVTDFHPQGNSHDVLQFSQSAFSSVAAVLSHAQQVGSNVVITYNAGDTVTLQNVSLNKLTQTDFHFV